MRRSGKSCFFRSYSHPQSAMGPRHSQEPSWVSGVNKISEESGRCACAYAQNGNIVTRGGVAASNQRVPRPYPPPPWHQAIITTPSVLLWPLVSAEWRTGGRRLTAAETLHLLLFCARAGKRWTVRFVFSDSGSKMEARGLVLTALQHITAD